MLHACSTNIYIMVYPNGSASVRRCDNCGVCSGMQRDGEVRHAGVPQHAELMCPSPSSCSFEHPTRSQQGSPRWAAAHEQLHRCTWAQFAQHMRDYLVTAAAKDCTIMMAMAKRDASQAGDGAVKSCAHLAPSVILESVAGQAATGHDAPVDACQACERMLRTAKAALEGTASSLRSADAQLHTCMQPIEVQGHRLAVRVGAVDFDCKPLSKVKKHWELDQGIVQHAVSREAGLKLT
jgi:Inositol-pentakisphosphate 2-kinase